MQKSISKLCKDVVAEGTVLLKNLNNLLPLSKGTKLAVFGRMQTGYYVSGTGSGSGASLKTPPCIIEELERNINLCIDRELVDLYALWVEKHPFIDGAGVWAGEPWFQEEMPLDDNTVKDAAKRNDVALIIIGRTSGEDHDNADEKGSYRLTDAEESMFKAVTGCFNKVIVALNVSNIIDLSFMDRYSISALIYLWQGGMYGAQAFSDMLTGELYPSGKMSDTQVFSISDHPAIKNFGDSEEIVYREDIYVGYRYFETFAPEKVRYPFGFGITYTTFEQSFTAECKENTIIVRAIVKNTGKYKGKDVVEVYCSPPCGILGTSRVQLIAFGKTRELKPGESDELTIVFYVDDMAAYDDSGDSGNKSCFVLQKGDYEILAGTDVRNVRKVLTYTVSEDTIIKKLNEALAPGKGFERIKAYEECGKRRYKLENAPQAQADTEKRILENLPQDLPFTGDRGIKLVDVKERKYTVDEFVSQLSVEELSALACGEGMNSPKSTPGAGGSIGGLNEKLSRYKIPVCCVTDGPCGIRLTAGKSVTVLPNGTLLACSWNEKLVCEVYDRIGKELKENEVDALLGPGINIHRNPLCGRNFEYFSEDPYLSGKIAAAVTRGIAQSGAYSTIKHFCCNNREFNRHLYDVSVSERALREIYLKPFEMAIKEGKNVLVMTSYNKVNGFYCASNYDLTSTVLRGEWNFDGIVMTDWWANCNIERYKGGDKESLQAMIKSGNDVYMVCKDSRVKSASIMRGIKGGYITLGQLQRCVINICKWIMNTNTFCSYVKAGCKSKYPITINVDNLVEVCRVDFPKSGIDYDIDIKSGKYTALVVTLCYESEPLAQFTLDIKLDDVSFPIILGADSGKRVQVVRVTDSDWKNIHKLRISYPSVLKIESIVIKQ